MPAKTLKKQSKLSSFFGKLNPNSPVKKLLAFVLVFAVLGGGYYAYRSFAATSVTVKNSAQLTGGTEVFATVNGKKVSYERVMAPNLATIRGMFPKPSKVSVKICVNVRNTDSHSAPVTIRSDYTNANNGNVSFADSEVKSIKANWSGWTSSQHNFEQVDLNYQHRDHLRVSVSYRDTIYDSDSTSKSRAAKVGIRQMAIVSSTASCPK